MCGWTCFKKLQGTRIQEMTSPLLKMSDVRTGRPSNVSQPYFCTLPPPMCRGDRIQRRNQLQPKHPWAAVQALSHSSQSLFFSLPLLTFPHNNAPPLMAAAPLSHFSKMTIRMNVKMEHFTSGWGPILTEDLPLAASDMEQSVSGWRVASINAKKKKSLWSREAGLGQIVRQFKTYIQPIIIWSVCVCLIPLRSWSQHSSLQEHFFFFSIFPQIPVDTALCMFTYEAACTCQSVCIPDAWAGIHGDGLGLELICSSTCEMRTRGEGDRQRRVPSHSHQAPIQTGADTLWYDGTYTHTQTDTYTRSIPPHILSFLLLFLRHHCTKQTWQPHKSKSRLWCETRLTTTSEREAMNEVNTHI